MMRGEGCAGGRSTLSSQGLVLAKVMAGGGHGGSGTPLCPGHVPATSHTSAPPQGSHLGGVQLPGEGHGHPLRCQDTEEDGECRGAAGCGGVPALLPKHLGTGGTPGGARGYRLGIAPVVQGSWMEKSARVWAGGAAGWGRGAGWAVLGA